MAAARRKTVAYVSDGSGGERRIEIAARQLGETLRVLAEKGHHGATAAEDFPPAFRLSGYVHLLRHRHGLAIESRDEPNSYGGQHSRYVLADRVRLVTETVRESDPPLQPPPHPRKSARGAPVYRPHSFSAYDYQRAKGAI